MLLILEGPDNAGKTTLAQTISKALKGKLTYFHPGGRPETITQELECIDEQMAYLKKGNVMLDRCTPISQQIYNHDGVLTMIRQEALQDMLKLGVLIIYCRPSTDRLLRTQDLTWRDGETDEHKQKIIHNQHEYVHAYDMLMAQIPCIIYNFEDYEQAKTIVDKIVSSFMDEKADNSWFNKVIQFGKNL